MQTAEQVLSHYRIEVQKSFGNEMRCLCPFHADSNPSLDMNTDGFWICRAGCGGGNLVQFVERMEGVDYKTAELLLNNNFSLVIDDEFSYLLQRLEDLREKADQVVERIPHNTLAEGFTRSILTSLKELPKTESNLVAEWLRVLTFMKGDVNAYTEADYVTLAREFAEDIKSIRNLGNVGNQSGR
jgi:DNA primase